MSRLSSLFSSASFASLALGVTSAGAEEPPRLPLDTITTEGGTAPFSATYAAGTRPGRKQPRYLRAALMDTGVLAAGTAYYWMWPSLNKRDWDYPDWQTRMAQLRPTFDNNLHFTNHVLHPFAGNLYYSVARLNGISVPGATAYAVVTSSMFEFFLEWLEKASINDLVFTPLAGVAAGEFLLRLGDYVNSAPRSRWYHHVAGSALGPSHRGMRALDGVPSTLPPEGMGADNLGLSAYYWHRFEVTTRAYAASNDAGGRGWVQDVAVEARIASIPGFLRPGRFSLAFDEGDLVEARVEVTGAGAARPSVDLWFDVNFWGRYRQDLDARRTGTASMIALDGSYRFLDRQIFGRHEQYAMVNLFGPAAKLWLAHSETLLSLEGALHPDFAAVRSFAYAPWTARHGAVGSRSALQAHGFDYGYGWSAWARAAVQHGGMELGGRAFLGSYGSFDCCDRFPEKLTRNPHGTERLLELDAWLTWRPARAPVHLQLLASHRAHRSAMGEFVVNQWDRRYGGGLGVTF